MKKVVFDCDNTFGVPGRDVDDGIALLYALGAGADVLAITATFGNGDTGTTYATSLSMVKRLKTPKPIPVFRGAAAPGDIGHPAARFLAEAAKAHRGELCVLATGSLSNLYAAHRIDPDFFENLAELHLMGGIESPLTFPSRTMDELNFSCDYKAAHHVLSQGKNIHIMTGNRCLDCLFDQELFEEAFKGPGELALWVRENALPFFRVSREVFGIPGNYFWDVFSAAALLSPQLFEMNPSTVSPTEASLKTGRLHGGGAPISVRLPRLRSPRSFERHVYDMLLKNQLA